MLNCLHRFDFNTRPKDSCANPPKEEITKQTRPNYNPEHTDAPAQICFGLEVNEFGFRTLIWRQTLVKKKQLGDEKEKRRRAAGHIKGRRWETELEGWRVSACCHEYGPPGIEMKERGLFSF